MTHKAPPCAGGGTAISLKVIEMSTLLTNNQLEFEKNLFITVIQANR